MDKLTIFRYILYLGIINIIFGFIWKWFFVIFTTIFIFSPKGSKVIRLLGIFGIYLFVSLIALLTLRAFRDNPGIISTILFSLIGAFTLYVNFVSNSYWMRKKFIRSMNGMLISMVQKDRLFMIGSLALYIFSLFVPIVVKNPLTTGFLSIIDRIFDFPAIIYWAIGIIGILFLIKTIFEGISMSGILMSSLAVKGQGQRPSQVINGQDERITKILDIKKVEYDDQDERIAKVLGIKNFNDIGDERLDVSKKTIKRYLKYLKEHIDYPCQLTGIEDFRWEEYYVFGPGNKKEYERLKKTRPSYTDKFTLLSFEDEIDSDEVIMVKVQRVSDKKNFSLPLAELEATDKKSKNYQLLDDYSVWFVNN